MKRLVATAAVALCAITVPARAQTEPAPAPYSLPWQLRGLAATTGVRSDTSIASWDDTTANGKGTFTIASMLSGSYRVARDVAVSARVAVAGGAHAAGVANPALGVLYAIKLPTGFRIGTTVVLTLPVGQGGGTSPDAATAAVMKAAMAARSAMDNALFAVNDLALCPGLDVAWVGYGVTVQAEGTVAGLVRTRGAPGDKDATKVNLMTGLHVGYFFIPQLSLGAELRYQRWLSTPAAVAKDKTGASRDNLTIGVGPRGNFRLGESTWFRPGLAYARGLDEPMTSAHYNIVQLDLPFTF